jgi:hypothetical protein
VIELDNVAVLDGVSEPVCVSDPVCVRVPVPLGVELCEDVVVGLTLEDGELDGVTEAVAPEDSVPVFEDVADGVIDDVADCDALPVDDVDAVGEGELVGVGVTAPVGVPEKEDDEDRLTEGVFDGVIDGLVPFDSVGVGEELRVNDVVGVPEVESEPVGVGVADTELVPESVPVGVDVPEIDLEVVGVADADAVPDGV